MPVDTYEAALDESVGVLVKWMKKESPFDTPPYDHDYTDDNLVCLWPNVPAPEPTDKLWMRAVMLPAAAQRASNSGSKSRFRNPGILSLELYGRSELGDSPVLELIDHLVPVFRSQSYDGLKFEVPAPVRIGEQAKALQYNLNCPFRFDAVGTIT